MNDQAALSARWQRLARRTAWKVNLAWWLDCSRPLWLSAGALGLAVIVWLRRQGTELSAAQLVPWWSASLLILAVIAWLWARRHFIQEAAAMVRLESQMHLHTALSVARVGRGHWPPWPTQVVDGLNWRWWQAGGPLAVCLLAWSLAISLPVSPPAAARLPSVEPQAWQEMAQWLDKLEEQKIITRDSRDEMAAKVEQLRQQPPEKWFSHESLHAGDTLKEQLQRELARQGENMAQAERSLNALQKHAGQLSDQAREQLLKEYAEAVEGMKKGSLGLDPDLLKELSQIDPKNVPNLSPEQLQELRDRLKSQGQQMAELGGERGFLGDGEGKDDELAEGRGRQPSPANPQEPFGDGDSTQGPGTAPLTLAEEENDFGAGRREAVMNPDYSRAQLGTLLQVQEGQHEVDKTYSGPQAAGAATHQGQGGQQVWRESLTPEEKAVLKRVFK